MADPYILFFRALKESRNFPEIRKNLERYLLCLVNSGERFQYCTMLKIIRLLSDKDFSDFGWKLLSCYIRYYQENLLLGHPFQDDENPYKELEHKLAKLIKIKRLRKKVLSLFSMISQYCSLDEGTTDVLIDFIDNQEIYNFLIRKTKDSCLLKKQNVKRLLVMVQEKGPNSKRAANLLEVVKNSN